MLSRLITAVSGTILIVSVIAFAAAAPAGAQQGVQQSGVKIGVFFPDPQFPGEQLPSNDDVNDFDALIGAKTDVFLWYESISENFYAETFEPMAQAGRTIQLAWEPHDFAKDPNNQPEYRLQTITAGNHDDDIRRWARELRDFGHEVLFRPMCEMNGDWVAWAGNANGNSPGDYIPAWRHIHDIFVEEGATNVKWVWSPNRDGSIASAQATFDTYYPGDAYVDYIGMNGYNWGRLYTTPQWTSQWQMLDEVFGYSYDVAVANTDKPVVICETATTEVGGDAANGGKAEWIRDAFEQLPQRFPRVELITWFNINKETDWRVNSSSESLEAFRAAVAAPDTEAPSVTIDSPAPGASLSDVVTVSATAADNAGVDRVELYVGDNLVETRAAAPFDFQLATRVFADGSYPLRVKAYDAAGNVATAEVSVSIDNTVARNYYMGWYDNATPGMRTWLIIGNPGTTPQHAEVYIGGALVGSYDIGPSQRVTPTYAGLVDGPVKVASTTGGELLVSERVIYNGSFSELAATPEEELSSDQLLAWYDQLSPGMSSWVVISNHGNQTAEVDVYLADELVGRYEVAAGDSIAPDYDGRMDGPLRVVCTNGQPLNVSQRVTYGAAFNEVRGEPSVQLASEYSFTWYDEQSPGMRTWVVVGNQGSQTAQVGIYIAEQLVGFYSIPAGGRVTPEFPNVMDGPVRVVCTNDQPLIVSQRSTYLGSFEEVPGAAQADLDSEQWFAWYDSASAGMKTWILVGNKSSQAVEVDIEIAGENMGRYSIPAGGRVTPVFPGEINGPVKVKGAAGQPLVVSQRTTFQNSFDELPGTMLN